MRRCASRESAHTAVIDASPLYTRRIFRAIVHLLVCAISGSLRPGLPPSRRPLMALRGRAPFLVGLPHAASGCCELGASRRQSALVKYAVAEASIEAPRTGMPPRPRGPRGRGRRSRRRVTTRTKNRAAEGQPRADGSSGSSAAVPSCEVGAGPDASVVAASRWPRSRSDAPTLRSPRPARMPPIRVWPASPANGRTPGRGWAAATGGVRGGTCDATFGAAPRGEDDKTLVGCS